MSDHDAYVHGLPLRLGNEFRLDGVDLVGFSFPELKVQTWHSLFGEGGSGSISVEAEHHFPRQPYETRMTLGRTPFVRGDDVTVIFKFYARAAANWNLNCRENWIELLRENVDKLASYHEGQIVEHRRKLDMATANLDTIAALEIEAGLR